MSFWKWWHETRVRYLLALGITLWLGWQWANVLRIHDGRIPAGPCVQLQAGDTPWREWVRMHGSQFPEDAAEIRRLGAQCAEDENPIPYYEEGVRRHFQSLGKEWGEAFPPILLLFGIMLSVSGPPAQVADGTAPLLLSLPRSRSRLLGEHVLWTVFALTSLALVAMASNLAVGLLDGGWPALRFVLLNTAFTVIVSGAGVALGVLASVLTRNGFAATLGAALIASAALWNEPVLLDTNPVGYAFIVTGVWQPVVMAGVTVVGCLALALLRFRRTDY